MATRFVREATKQLSPGYTQQVSALQGQIPAIQQLYETLMQGLTAQQQMGNQNILEGAAGRGVLRSTIPVDAQTMLGQQILQQQGQYSLEQQRATNDILSQIAGVNVNRANAISSLANSLRGTALNEQQFRWTKSNANRQYQLDKKLNQQNFKLSMAAAQKGI